MKNSYSFHSVWVVEGSSFEKVMAILSDIEMWPSWWPYMKTVKKLSNNTYAFEVGTWFYTLRFVMQVETLPHMVRYQAVSGDLVGEGSCTFVNDVDTVKVAFTWNVTDQRMWLYKIPKIHTLLSLLHQRMMKRGETSLAKKVTLLPLP